MTSTGMTRLAEFRDRWKLKQYELAARIQVTDAYLSQILSGKRRPSLPIAVRIERETGVPVESWMDTQVSKLGRKRVRKADTVQNSKVLSDTPNS